MNQPASPPKAKRSCLARFLLFSLIVILLVIVGLAGATWYLYREATSVPEWWVAIDADDPEVVQLADHLENRLSRELTRPRSLPYDEGSPADPDQPSTPASDENPDERQISLTQRELNAWVAAKAPQWLANQEIKIPEQVKDYRIGLREGLVIISFAVEIQNADRFLSFSFKPITSPEGIVQARLDRIGFGRVSLPADGMNDLIQQLSSGDPAQERHLEQLQTQLEKLQATDLKLPIDEARQVELIQADLKEGEATLTIRTVPRSDQP